MRESIGGSMLFYIVLFFLSVFIFFIASVIRYARVYKIKNSVINYIERNEGIVEKSDIDKELGKMGYDSNGAYKICRYFPSELGGYYSLELYARFELPIVGNWYYIDVAIKGDTHTITSGTKIKSIGNGSLFTTLNDQCFICGFGDSESCNQIDLSTGEQG